MLAAWLGRSAAPPAVPRWGQLQVYRKCPTNSVNDCTPSPSLYEAARRGGVVAGEVGTGAVQWEAGRPATPPIVRTQQSTRFRLLAVPSSHSITVQLRLVRKCAVKE